MGAPLLTVALVAAACRPACPVTDAERAAIADTLRAIASRQDTVVTAEACLAALDIFSGDEPMVVSDGRVIRSLAALEALCRGTESGITRVQLDIVAADAHVLSSDLAYLVPEGDLVYHTASGPPVALRHVSTIIFQRGGEGSQQMHYHESTRLVQEP